MRLNHYFEREVPSMSKAKSPKDGKMSKIHFLCLSVRQKSI